MVNDRSRNTVVALVVCLALFCTLFATLLYPEIERSRYAPTTCTVTACTIVPRYCCRETCDVCSLTFEPWCATYRSDYERRDPHQCATDARQCAPDHTVCGGGYRCCATVCDTCRSCTTKDGKQTCRTYTCNCHCSFSTPNTRCVLTCPQCYRVDVVLTHAHGSGVVRFEHGTDLGAAEARVREFFVTRELPCFYRGNDVVLSNDFSSTTIAVFTLIGVVPLWLVLMVACSEAVDMEVHVARFTLTWPLIVVWTWLGVVLPWIVLLPIALWGAMTLEAQRALYISVGVFGVAFTLPGLLTGALYAFERGKCQRVRLAEPIPMLPVAETVQESVAWGQTTATQEHSTKLTVA